MPIALPLLSFELTESHVSTLDTTWQGRGHCDDVCRLYVVRSGQAHVRIGDVSIRLTPGHAYLIPAHRRFDYWCVDTFVQEWTHFRVHATGGLDLFAHLDWTPKIDLPPRDPLRHQTGRLRSLVDVSTIAAHLERSGLLAMLVARFVTDRGRDTSEFDRFGPVLEFLQHNLRARVRVTDLARIAHLERSHFSKAFARAFGVSPVAYIQRVRIERARSLLLDTDRTQEDIARECGYSDVFHFGHAFRKHTGISPGAFRGRGRSRP